jgi:GNAT superfamily N-acetyltransferase
LVRVAVRASDEYTISTDRSRLDVEVIHRFLSEESYWARGRTREVTDRSIENSVCFGVYRGEEQVGFARAVTDRATFAWLADVFILPEHRGQGLGKRLVEAALGEPSLEGVYRWVLGTADAHELYRRYGFTEPSERGRFMIRESVDDARRCANG